MAISDWKNEFDNASTRNSSEYMDVGNYLLRVDNVVSGKNRQGVENFKLEGTIIHKLDESGPQNVGQSVCAMYSKKSDYFHAEVKGLVKDIFGLDKDEVSFKHLEKIAAEGQPLKGCVVEFIAYKKDPAKVFVSKFCRGMKSASETKAMLSEGEWAQYEDSLKYLG